MKKIIALISAALALASCTTAPGNTAGKVTAPAEIYDQMQRQLASGWNTWDTRSVLKHVLLPYGAAVDINLVAVDGKRVNTFQVGDRGQGAPVMRPGPHTYDGTYTDISVDWNGLSLRVQSAAEGEKNVILITPLAGSMAGGKVVVTPKPLWFRAMDIPIEGNKFSIEPRGFDVKIPSVVNGAFIKEEKGEIIVSADKPAVICCGGDMSLAEAEAFIASKADGFNKANRDKYGEHYELYNAMQSVLAWDNIYDPVIKKVITPVSRIWNIDWGANRDYGGFVLFCWDTYFASMMFSIDNKELAYANAIEITASLTESGFVPNFYASNDYKSRDRSQPCVGSLAVWNIYKRYGEKWFLEMVYDNLLTWNRWWDSHRNIDGLLCWGSDPFEKVTYRWFESDGVGERFGGSLESGLDNSHMYDDIKFDKGKHMLLLNDAGLSGLYVMDCDLLADIAAELGQTDDEKELRTRADKYRRNLAKLWDDKRGFYYNRHTDTGELNPRISPTNFYPMLAKAPTQEQAERMIAEHFRNPEEFWGEWMIPATPRNDPAFHDNTYWRGRIWAPMNFLVYMGLRNYDLPEARKELSEKSQNLLLKSWNADRYVFENYNSVTGQGDDVPNSDKFYHWGSLLGFITLIEEGYYFQN